MGVCRVDTEKGHREYMVRYALNDRDGVDALLRYWHRLRARRFERADYAASDILIDLRTAITAARLTDRQRQALHYVYVRDLTMDDAGERMGIGKQRVSRLVITGLNRIANVYAAWNYGEVSREEQWERATATNCGDGSIVRPGGEFAPETTLGGILYVQTKEIA